jgi:hypothetical protein
MTRKILGVTFDWRGWFWWRDWRRYKTARYRRLNMGPLSIWWMR